MFVLKVLVKKAPLRISTLAYKGILTKQGAHSGDRYSEHLTHGQALQITSLRFLPANGGPRSFSRAVQTASAKKLEH